MCGVVGSLIAEEDSVPIERESVLIWRLVRCGSRRVRKCVGLVEDSGQLSVSTSRGL